MVDNNVGTSNEGTGSANHQDAGEHSDSDFGHVFGGFPPLSELNKITGSGESSHAAGR